MHCNLRLASLFMKQKRHWKDLYNPSAFADRYCKTGMMLACFSQWALIDFLSSSPRPALRRNLRACFFTFCKFFVLIAARATPNLSCARVVDIKSPALKDIKFPMLHMFISSEGLYIHSLQYLVSCREQQKNKTSTWKHRCQKTKHAILKVKHCLG